MSAGESASLEHAIAVARIRGAEAIVLAFPWSDTRKVELVRDGLQDLAAAGAIAAGPANPFAGGNPSFRLQNSLSVEIQRGPLSRAEQLSKRLLDIVGALVGLVVLAALDDFERDRDQVGLTRAGVLSAAAQRLQRQASSRSSSSGR